MSTTRRSRFDWPLWKTAGTFFMSPLNMWAIILKSLSHAPSGPSFSAFVSRASARAWRDFTKSAGSRTMFSLCLRAVFW